MIKDTDLIQVRNRNMGSTGYSIPERNLHRTWGAGETKKIPFEELKTFSFLPGGIYALKNLFVIENKEALDMLLNEEVEPEYHCCLQPPFPHRRQPGDRLGIQLW